MTGAPWFVAVSNTSCERRATQGLHAAGYEVWRPCQWMEVRYGKGRWPACKQLFPAPGYLLVRARLPDLGWYGMYSIDGIKAVLCVDFHPLCVPDRDVLLWRIALAPSFAPMIEDAYRIGSQVRISSGPFEGVLATVERIVSGGVWVTALMFNQTKRMQIDRGMLEQCA